jgi:hypothetical protein
LWGAAEFFQRINYAGVCQNKALLEEANIAYLET